MKVGGGDENGGEVIGEIENCENYVGGDGGKIDWLILWGAEGFSLQKDWWTDIGNCRVAFATCAIV